MCHWVMSKSMEHVYLPLISNNNISPKKKEQQLDQFDSIACNWDSKPTNIAEKKCHVKIINSSYKLIKTLPSMSKSDVQIIIEPILFFLQISLT